MAETPRPAPRWRDRVSHTLHEMGDKAKERAKQAAPYLGAIALLGTAAYLEHKRENSVGKYTDTLKDTIVGLSSHPFDGPDTVTPQNTHIPGIGLLEADQVGKVTDRLVTTIPVFKFRGREVRTEPIVNSLVDANTSWLGAALVGLGLFMTPEQRSTANSMIHDLQDHLQPSQPQSQPLRMAA